MDYAGVLNFRCLACTIVKNWFGLLRFFNKILKRTKCSDTCQHKIKFVLTFTNNDQTLV